MPTSSTPPYDARLAWRQRVRASAIHMVSCITVAMIVAALVLLIWYPWPYRVISGGEQLLFLVMGVDIIMGPLITLAIFDLRKPMQVLKRDLAVIVALQLAALFYGLHTVYIARPVALALEGTRFRVTTAVQVVSEELPRAPEGLRSLPLDGPRLVATVEPSAEERGDAIFMAMAGADLGARPLFWRAWGADARRETLKAGKPIGPMLTSLADRSDVDAAIARTGRSADQLLAIPVIARRLDWSVLIDKTTGDPVGFAPIDAF
ncbi:TfpX/TfpZ family type IV pilin accessory protein [Roseateles sp. 22389]|uniref:TfpX/TfpZ family type IV pilin accessory protein n=1 Tax=Roseateles sp. 22389 TaxID=3453916 RepID=UPI003F82A445